MSGFSSSIFAKEIVISDDYPDDGAAVENYGKGLDLSSRPDGVYGYGATANPFPSQLLIDPSEFQARIKEKEETKSRISDAIRRVNSPCKNQQSTNFCWANAPTRCVEILRIQQNETPITLSPASVACRINGFRNQGGWGKDALQYIIDHGVDPVSLWPANAIDRKYDTQASKTAAMAYRVLEWNELRPRNMQELVSCLLRGLPVAVGFNWWSHEVTAIDAVWMDGAPAIRIENSWGTSWGDNGFGILQGSKALPDDAVTPRTTLVS